MAAPEDAQHCPQIRAVSKFQKPVNPKTGRFVPPPKLLDQWGSAIPTYRPSVFLAKTPSGRIVRPICHAGYLWAMLSEDGRTPFRFRLRQAVLLLRTVRHFVEDLTTPRMIS